MPYKGSAPAITDVMNGQVTYMVETVASVVGHIRNGRLKALAVTTARRAAALPEVPTLAEAAGFRFRRRRLDRLCRAGRHAARGRRAANAPKCRK